MIRTYKPSKRRWGVSISFLPHLHVVTGLTIFSAHVQNNDLGWVVEWAGGVDGWLVNFCIRVAGDVFGGDGNDLIEFQVAAGLQLFNALHVLFSGNEERVVD